jgi:uncharacterized protein (TIGR03000 family)
MFRKAFFLAGILLLSGAAVLATPRLSQAQHGGGHIGGQFGGGHLSGTWYGGHYDGGHMGGYHYGYGGGYQSDPYHDAYGPYSPYSSGSYFPNDYYPYSGLSPSYGSNFSNLYGSGVPYLGGATTAAPAAGYQSFYPAPPDTTAHVTVHVPADARVWFDGAATTSTGAVREFQSPSLASGSQYTYDLRAQWNENGHTVEQTKKVAVTAGGRVRVDFPKDR